MHASGSSMPASLLEQADFGRLRRKRGIALANVGCVEQRVRQVVPVRAESDPATSDPSGGPMNSPPVMRSRSVWLSASVVPQLRTPAGPAARSSGRSK